MQEGGGIGSSADSGVDSALPYSFFGCCRYLTCLGSFRWDCPAAGGACPACQNTYQKLSDKYPLGVLCCGEEV